MYKIGIKYLAQTALVSAMMAFAAPAYADCTAPTSPEGGLNYVDAATGFTYCDGTNWLPFGSGGAAGAIDDLSDAYTIYDAGTTSNFIMGRAGAAALTAGAAQNLFIGENAGATTANSTGTTDANTAVGYSALTALTIGSGNTATGNYSLYSNTTGTRNTAIGVSSLYANTTGNFNTGIGSQAAYATTTGSRNTSLGDLSLRTNVAGSLSTAIGYGAMRYANNSSTAFDSNNTAVGGYALRGSTSESSNTGLNNTALGSNALYTVSTGSSNTASGSGALYFLTTGAGNTALGYAAGTAGTGLTTGSNNTLIGHNTQADANNYDNSTALGYGAIITASNMMVFGNSSVTSAVFSGTGAVRLPNGTDAQRPTGAGGMIRYNTDATPSDVIEYYDAQTAAWIQLPTSSGSSVFEVTGGAGTELVRQVTAVAPYATSDFLFGSAQMADAGNATEDSRMFFDKSKGAFRAGTADGTQWDDANVGNYSFASGSHTIASGAWSSAFGLYSTASGDYSTALGASTIASGQYSTATGRSSTASGASSFASGRSTIAAGVNSTAFGREVTVSGTGISSMGIGLTSAAVATDPIVSGAESLGIFMGDQSGVDLAQANTMALMGGKLGIGTVTPSVELEVVGDIEYSGSITDVSDMRLKTDISNLSQNIGIINKIYQIDTYSFRMKNDPKGQIEFGVMAQELERIFPELVHTAKDEMGTKSVNYVGLIPPMIEAVKNLRHDNRTLLSEVSELRAQNAKFEDQLSTLAAQVDRLNRAGINDVHKASLSLTTLFLILLCSGLTLGLGLTYRRNKSNLKTLK